MRPGEHVFMDIMHPVSRVGLTADTTYAFYLILVDAHSCYVCLYDMCDKTIESVVRTIQHYQADHGHVGNYGYLDLECVCAYAGTQFTHWSSSSIAGQLAYNWYLLLQRSNTKIILLNASGRLFPP